MHTLAKHTRWLAASVLLAYGCQGRSSNDATAGAIATVDTSAPAKNKHGGAFFVADCNDPATSGPCADLSAAVQAGLKAHGYPYYLGHAEPAAEFFSTSPGSANNLQWRFKLPATDPTPTQNGSSVANFELFTGFWLSMALCDPTSSPFGACVPDSDSNGGGGAALLELQFYPPGAPEPFGQPVCSTSQWCAALTIDSASNDTNCPEPVTLARITLNGSPTGTSLLMSNGDDISVTLQDTTNGLEAIVTDLTRATGGSMVASAGNKFQHLVSPTGCTTEFFGFHPLYSTASATNIVPWTSLQVNVGFSMEIGHFELCGDSNCNMLPDGNDEGTCSNKSSQDCSSNSDCPTGGTCIGSCAKSSARGIGFCSNEDLDLDGLSYQADWPDGTSSHPASVIIEAQNGTGVGPMSAIADNPGNYLLGYPTVRFATTTPIGGALYPFYSEAGYGQACVFNFGNDIPGTTSNDFSRSSQYGTSIYNPCPPGLPAEFIMAGTQTLM